MGLADSLAHRVEVEVMVVMVVVAGTPPLNLLPHPPRPPAAQQRDGRRFMRKEEEKAARPRRPCQLRPSSLFLCPRLPAIPSEASATKFHHKHTGFLPLLNATLSRGPSVIACAAPFVRSTPPHTHPNFQGKKEGS